MRRGGPVGGFYNGGGRLKGVNPEMLGIPPFSRSGMSLYQDDPKTLSVVNVLPDGPAAKAGIQKGDVLISVAGNKTGSLPKRAIIRMFTQEPGTTVPVTYLRNGKEFRAAIVLKELLP